MAYLYLRTDSKYFWLSFVDGNGLRRSESTRLRHGKEFPAEIRKAHALEAQRTAEELARNAGQRSGRGSGWSWVSGWMQSSYSHTPGTLRTMLYRWKPVSLFLTARKITGPESVTRQACFDYIPWRLTKPAGCYGAAHNTALAELHLLSIVMGEAMNRQFVDVNPCVRLRIRKHETKRKPELTAADDAKIRQNIPKVKREIVREMLYASFEIARKQGCRLAETRINFHEDVDLKRMRITFKTKTRKAHTTALHPGLVPIIKKLIRDGHAYSWDAPEGHHPGRWAGKEWWAFLHKIKLGKTFHSTRVTVATELARAGVSRTKAMAFLGHSTSLIHSVYTRLQPDDLTECVSAIRG